MKQEMGLNLGPEDEAQTGLNLGLGLTPGLNLELGLKLGLNLEKIWG